MTESAPEAVTETDALADIVEAAHEPIYIDPSETFMIVREHLAEGGDRVRPVDLESERERHAATPNRIRRHTALGDVDSFNTYLSRYWHPEKSIVYRTGPLAFSCIIDGDPAGPSGEASWGGHKASLVLRYSDRLAPWQGHDRALLSQTEFVNFLEDHIRDVVEPDAADLIEMVQFLTGHTTTNWSSAYSTKDGARRLVWEESMTTAGKVRQGGSRDLPGTLTLRLPLFQHDGDNVEIEARLRIRVRDGQVRLGFILDDLNELVEARMADVIAEISEAGHGPVLTAATV